MYKRRKPLCFYEEDYKTRAGRWTVLTSIFQGYLLFPIEICMFFHWGGFQHVTHALFTQLSPM